jgi:DNA/RNA endonuclease G (NUC1)
MKKILLFLVFTFLTFSIFPCDLEGHFDFEVKDSKNNVLYEGCYDAIHKGPHIIEYVLKPLAEVNAKRASTFSQKSDGGALLQAMKDAGYLMPTTGDYAKSGYERGHMASAEDFDYNKEAKDATFFVANIWPQDEDCNNPGAWYKSEIYGRELAVSYGEVKITTIVDDFSDKWIGTRKDRTICVPNSFTKILEYTEPDGVFHKETYVIPNIPKTQRSVKPYLVDNE